MQLTSSGIGFDDVKPLPCKRWACEYCQPRRRRRLLAIAAAGRPNKFLTLTVNVAVGASPLDRRNLLHDAWKRLVKRMLRQWALPPERRWRLIGATRSSRREAIVRAITAKTPQRGCDRLPYMAFLEATEAGEPHLHILLRCPYVPQDWIAEQMADMLGSPVCDIREIRGTRAAVTYVTKYVTKAPAQFGNTRRYWISKGWEVEPRSQDERQPGPARFVSVRRKNYLEWIAEISDPLTRKDLMADGWVRVWHRAHCRKENARWQSDDTQIFGITPSSQVGTFGRSSSATLTELEPLSPPARSMFTTLRRLRDAPLRG